VHRFAKLRAAQHALKQTVGSTVGMTGSGAYGSISLADRSLARR